jgi:hypothetical protein
MIGLIRHWKNPAKAPALGIVVEIFFGAKRGKNWNGKPGRRQRPNLSSLTAMPLNKWCGVISWRWVRCALVLPTCMHAELL